jgi:F-box/leucine-rich repeat protein 2/20
MPRVVLDFQDAPTDLDLPHQIQELSLNGCSEWVDDEFIESITSTTQSLRHVSLYRCLKITDRSVYNIVSTSKSLETLNLSGCLRISDKSLKFIGRNLQNLRNLDLTRCPEITDLGINYLTFLCNSLECLTLYADSQLGPSAHEAIAEMSKLKRIDLCGHCKLTDNSLVRILTNTPDIQYLNLSWCVSLSGHVVDEIVSQRLLQKIETISLFGIRNLENCRTLVEYLSKIPSIRGLDIRGIPTVSDLTENDCKNLRTIIPSLVEWKLHT